MSERMERARLARLILDGGFFPGMEAEIMAAWADATNTESREQRWRELWAIRTLKQAIEIQADDGNFARKEETT